MYYPKERKGEDMIPGGMGWIIVDALDTAMIMNLTTQVQHARSWIQHSLRYDQDEQVSTFETTIRMLGGLLSAHHLSTAYPNLAPVAEDDRGQAGEDLYIEKATDLANRLLGAFESGSGLPYSNVNLNTSQGIRSHTDTGSSSTAEATTLQLEFKYLAKLTGEANYWKVAEKALEVVESNGAEGGLVPIFISADVGRFTTNNIRVGSRGDSHYEYLIKQYLQTEKEEPIYKDMWDEALAGMCRHLITYSQNADLTVLGERPNGLDSPLSAKMDHLVCFLPGSIVLAATGGVPVSQARKSPGWGQQQEEDILLARELTKTCWAMYAGTATGLAGEITYYAIDDPPRTIQDVYQPRKPNPKKLNIDLPLLSKPLWADPEADWARDVSIKPNDRHNLQRPETIESFFYMYRILEDETYRHWGWSMFKSFIQHTAVFEESATLQIDRKTGKKKLPDDTGRIRSFTSLDNADTLPAVQRDNMESFWMAETLKYFYLLFSDRDFIPLEKNVFNTEAHPFPRFQPGKAFKTGWGRKHGDWRERSKSQEEKEKQESKGKKKKPFGS